MDDDGTMKSMAPNTVFSAYELVVLIVPSLDKLSFVRIQRVNCTFRNVVKESTKLQQGRYPWHQMSNVSSTFCSY